MKKSAEDESQIQTFFAGTSPFIRYALVVVLLFVSSHFYKARRSERSLPPGPPALPVIGNLHQISRDDFHIRATRWAQQYGGIFSLKNGSGTMIVLTDRVAIKQLLDKRGANFADRPDMYVLTDLVTNGSHILPMRYGAQWRKLRRFLQDELSEAKCDQKHLLLQDAEAVQMLVDLMRDPAEFKVHIRRFSTSIMTSIVCGVRMPTAGAQLMRDLEKIFYELVSATVIGATPPVDQIPIFKYLPDCLWNNWRSRALRVGRRLNALYSGLVSHVGTRRAAGENCYSFLGHMIDQQEKGTVTGEELVSLCATLLEGGSETSSATIQVFLEAIFKYPEVQRQAHKQIDAVFDEFSMPTWGDYDRLPYISQVIKETIRWRPISPVAFPHATANDDSYAGYFIPARSTVIVNVYGLHRDPQYFPEPDEFRPDRFAGLTAPADHLSHAANPETGRDHYGYGAGRRICPGIHLAERNLFIGISKLLWAFEFERLSDSGASGGDVISGPDGLKCRIKVRSEERRKTILRQFEAAKSDVFNQYEAGS